MGLIKCNLNKQLITLTVLTISGFYCNFSNQMRSTISTVLFFNYSFIEFVLMLDCIVNWSANFSDVNDRVFRFYVPLVNQITEKSTFDIGRAVFTICRKVLKKVTY